MGGVKQSYLEDEDRGFRSEPELFVCDKHFGDSDIIKYIQDNSSVKHRCSFCTNTGRNSKVIAWDELMELLLACIRQFYDDPGNGLSYESTSGGYLGKTYDTQELIEDVICIEADFDVLEQISSSIILDLWTEAEFYGDSYSQHLSYSWDTFSHIVKYNVRYLFNQVELDDDGLTPAQQPWLVLDDIADFIKKLDLFFLIPKKEPGEDGLCLYRARQHKKKELILTCEDIGSAPREFAGANRFSPEGISMFYGTIDQSTAISEVFSKENSGKHVSIGEFFPNKDLLLVDLRSIPVFGFFDKKNIDMIEPTRFLKDFVNSISMTITQNDNKRIEYIPSQIVTEYIRHILPSTVRKEIHGIVYKSVQEQGKDCYVIFADQTQCRDEGSENVNTLLSLKSNSIKRIKIT